MKKFNQAINPLRPPDLEQKSINGRREEDGKAALTQHKAVKHTIAAEAAGAQRTSAG